MVSVSAASTKPSAPSSRARTRATTSRAFIVEAEDVPASALALCVDRCPTGVIILGKLAPQVAAGDPHTRTNRNGYAYGVRF